MKVTHDQVRALLDSHREELCERHDAEDDAECSLCGLHAIGFALCEEWLSRHTARVVNYGEYGFALDAGSGERLAYVERNGNSWRGVRGDHSTDWRTEGDPCAWLEERAREWGYEVRS